MFREPAQPEVVPVQYIFQSSPLSPLLLIAEENAVLILLDRAFSDGAAARLYARARRLKAQGRR